MSKELSSRGLDINPKQNTHTRETPSQETPRNYKQGVPVAAQPGFQFQPTAPERVSVNTADQQLNLVE